METVEVIEYRNADIMRYAGISEQTRELLIMLAGLQDIENSFCNWKNKYGLIDDDDTGAFINKMSESEETLYEVIKQSISDNMGRITFKAI